jgi:hypothetical protein
MMTPAGFLENSPINSFQPDGIVPVEYQGWVFLLFLLIGTACVIYTFWLIANDKRMVELRR